MGLFNKSWKQQYKESIINNILDEKATIESFLESMSQFHDKNNIKTKLKIIEQIVHNDYYFSIITIKYKAFNDYLKEIRSEYELLSTSQNLNADIKVKLAKEYDAFTYKMFKQVVEKMDTVSDLRKKKKFY